MTQEDTLVVRESRTTVVVALIICALLAGMGTLSSGGPFQFAAIGFIILTAFFITIVLWSAAYVTVLTPEGLQIRHFGRGRKFSWDEKACLRYAVGWAACTAGRTDQPVPVPCRSITRNNP